MTLQTATPIARNRKAAIPQPKAVPEREIARPVRHGRVEAMARDGTTVLSRKRKASGDMFTIDQAIIPPGWDYQWNPYTVMGENQIDSQIAMAENGWRPVPAERQPGMFMPEGHKGSVIRGGLILEERPMELTLEAKEEERLKARAQIRDAKETLGLSMPAGFSGDAGQYKGVGVNVKNTITPVYDAPRPQLDIAND